MKQDKTKKKKLISIVKDIVYWTFLIGGLSTVVYFSDEHEFARERKIYDSVLYEDKGDSLTLYEPHSPRTWQEHSAKIRPEYLIGTVAKSDIKYKNKSKNKSGKNIAATVSGDRSYTRNDIFRRNIDSYAVDGEITCESLEKLKAAREYAKSLPDFKNIEKVVVYNEENKDLFFKPAYTK